MNILYPIYTLRFVDDKGNTIFRYKHNVGITINPTIGRTIYVYKMTKDNIVCEENISNDEIKKFKLSPDEFVSIYCDDLSGYDWKYQKEWVLKNHNDEYIFPGESVIIHSFTNIVYGEFEYTGIRRGACGTFAIFKNNNGNNNYDCEFLEFGNPEYTGNIPEDKIEYVPLFNDYRITKPCMEIPKLD